jgi:hypothetical protein
LGVLVGIILLIVEIRHNTATTQAVLHQENVAFGRDHAERLLNDENHELAEIIFRGLDDPDTLSGIELRKFLLYTAWELTPWESTFLHLDEGLVSQRDWKTFDRGYSTLISLPGYRVWWDAVGNSYDPKFQTHVNKIFEELDQK